MSVVEDIKEALNGEKGSFSGKNVSPNGDSTDLQNEESITWLIFSVNERIYAIEAPMAKEILRGMDIYPLPFVPDYIKGVINRHGDPYTVVDLSAFLGDEVQSASLFIVLNLEDSQFCIQITDILDFHTNVESSVVKISDGQENVFFNGTIEYQNQNVPIIQLEKIYEKIRNDIES